MHLFMIPHVDIISRGSLTQGNSFFIFYIYLLYLYKYIYLYLDRYYLFIYYIVSSIMVS